MSRTERRRWAAPMHNPYAPQLLDDSARDDGCQHWMCNGWKRPDRRRRRQQAKAALRRDPDSVPGR